MTLPKYNDFYEPVLKFLADEKIHDKNEISDYIVNYFKLTKEDIEETSDKGKRPIFISRLSWVLSNLVRINLLTREGRGKYLISNEGLDLINTDSQSIKNTISKKLTSDRKNLKRFNNVININIQNFGAISESNMNIGKINIVGGQNATGKSTASKLLYCFLKYSSSNRREDAYKPVIKQIQHLASIMRRFAPSNIDEEYLKFFRDISFRLRRIDDLDHVLESYEKLKDIAYELEFDSGRNDKKVNMIFDEFEEIDNLINIIEEDGNSLFNLIMKDLLESEFSNKMKGFVEFYGIFNQSKFTFTSNFSKDYNFDKYGEFLINDVFYIDSFSLLDIDQGNGLTNTNHVQSLLKNIRGNENKSSKLFDDVLNMDIIKLEKNINKLISGEFQYDKGELKYSDDYGIACHMSNTASGIKQIGIIQLLLSNRKLKENSFLIIDEPEVNLHPEWQVKLAEILVILAKHLNIYVYINTHSPMFVEAMSLYSQYHDLLNDTNIYLTEKHKTGGFTFKKIDSKDMGAVYENLSRPYDDLDEIKTKLLLFKD